MLEIQHSTSKSFRVTDKKSDQKGHCRKNFSGMAALLLLLIWCSNNVRAQQPQAAKAMVQKQAANPQQVQKFRIPAQIFQIQMVYVPQLVGRKYDFTQLSAALERIGLRLGKTLPVPDNQNIGIILSQSVPPREQVRRNSAIDITYGVAAPPETQPNADLVAVPNYLGITLDEALGRIPNDRLTAGERTEVQSDEPRGVIVAQFPVPEIKVDPFTRVNLSYSAGPQPEMQVGVPDLVGRSLQEAAELLQQAGLFAGKLTGRVSNDNPGTILEQSPGPGQQVNPKTSVDLTYSVQQQEILIPVPDVTGLPLEEARQILHKNRLADRAEFIQRHGVPENRVIQQDPLPATKVPAGAEIHLLVSGREILPPWIIWGGGLAAAVLIGGFAGWKFGKGKSRRSSGEQNLEITMRLIPDPGKQTLIIEDDNPAPDGLNLKIVPDQGIQTLKIDEHEI
jgi:beta-lactam-binding protein with PASTA domain